MNPFQRIVPVHPMEGRALLSTLAMIFLSATALAHGGVKLPPNLSTAAGGLAASGPFVPLGTVVTDSRDHAWDLLHYGTADFGGDVGASVNATRSYVSGIPYPGGSPAPANYRSSAALYSRVRFFGSTVDAASLTAKAEDEPYLLSPSGATPKSGYKAKTSLDLVLGSNTVYSYSADGVTLSKTWSDSWGPIDTSRVTHTFFAWGFVPITLQAWAGASAEASLTATANLASVALDLAGTASAVAYGIGQAGVGFTSASAGLAVEVDLANPTIDAALHAGLFDGFNGHLTACTTPVTLILQLYAELHIDKGWFTILQRKTWDLVSWSTGQKCDSYAF